MMEDNMSDAPERIWAYTDGLWIEAWDAPPSGAEYIRADVAAAMVAQAYERAVTEAMGVVASIGYGKNEDVDAGHEEAFRAIEAHLKDWLANA